MSIHLWNVLYHYIDEWNQYNSSHPAIQVCAIHVASNDVYSDDAGIGEQEKTDKLLDI